MNKNIALLNFLGNHDTSRIRSILSDERFLFPAYIFLFTTNGIPKIYYGDEIGMYGNKHKNNDDDVRRPMIDLNAPRPENGYNIFQHIQEMIKIRKNNHALIYGDLTPIFAQDNILVYVRKSSKQTILVIINNQIHTSYNKIPFHNVNLNEARFIDILNSSNNKEYSIQNNYLDIESYPCWGNILIKVN